MEQYFEELSTNMEGYAEFEKEAWSFKVRYLHFLPHMPHC
jgi:hypothetical protein